MPVPVASYHLIWIVLLCCTADLQAHMLYEAPMDMVVAAESVYILGSSSITQLHRNLSLLNEAPLTFKQQVEATRNDALSMAIRENETELVVCFAYGKCFLFYMVDDGYCTDDNSFIASFGYPTNVLLTDIEMNSFYIAFRALDQGPQLRFLKLEQFSIDEIIYDDLYSDYYEEEPIPLEINRIRSLSLSITNSSFRDRIFINAFRLGNHVYFVGRDEDTDSMPKITLMRICDKGNQMFSTEGYDVYEIRLSCGPVSAETSITGVFVLDNTMVLGLTNRRYSRHCTFNLSRINMILDSAYDQCSSGDYDNPLPWAIYNHHSCTTFQEIAESRCNFGSPNQGSGGIVPALAVNSAAIGEVAVEVWNYSVHVSLAVAADNVMLVYLAASNATGHYLLKYYSGGDSDTILVEEYEHSQPVVVLKQAEDHIYVATNVEVFRYKVFSDCSQYSSCDSCTAMKDPVCGWCVLENKCSRALVCSSSELIGRWINNQKQCIVNVSLSNKFSTIEKLSNVSFVTIPSTSVFPSLTKNESFTCVFTDIITKTIHNLTVQDSFCVGDNFNLTLLNTSFTQLSVRILSDNDSPSIEFNSNSVLTVFDCSKYKRCISCQHAPGCGWCVYDHKCTGDSFTCRVPTDWRAASHHQTDTCPILLKPPSGRYLQPVGVSKKLDLSTQYIPPPILGHKYVCRIRCLGKQSIEFDVEAKYTLTSMNVSCQFKREQTRQLLQMTSGVGGAQLSLLYVDSNGTIKEKIDFSRDTHSDSQEPAIEQSDMLLYDCFQLGTSCSTCISLRLRPEGFACGWCTSSGCTLSWDCYGYIQDLSGRFCPHPIIQSVSPSSGPIQGGTVVTITGDDLGINLTSIESIMFGQHPCSLIANEYQPGRVIKCMTSAATDSETVHISLTVNRGGPGLVGATPIFEFHYENPTITSIYPRYGPISGGTLVVIEGSSLNTGDEGSAVISLAGQDCFIRSKTSERILCVTSPNEAGDGFIHISIDGANIYEGFYLYLPDPVIFSVSPSTIIESGGITLTFTGSNLNSTVKPTLLVFKDQQEYVGVCEGVNATALECKAPRVTALFANGSARRYSPKPLNYTIIMDNAPRPNTTNPELTLVTKSDPVFVEIQEADKVYVRGSQEFIAILGRDINNVQATEIAVSVDGLPCDNIILSQNVLRCKPPPSMGLSTAVYHADVKVTVGSGSLEYNVGVLEYIQDNSLMNVTMIIAVAMGSLLGIILMIFLVCTLVLSGRFIWRNCSKRNLEEVVNVDQNGQQEFSPPEYDYVSHENVYEDISDLAIEMGGAFQPGVAGAELPRLEVASRRNREVRRDGMVERNRQGGAMRRDGAARRDVARQDGVDATPAASGEYVDMLPPSLRMSCPTSSMQNPTQNQTCCVLAPKESTPPATANVQNDENADSEDDRSIRVTKLRCALEL